MLKSCKIKIKVIYINQTIVLDKLGDIFNFQLWKIYDISFHESMKTVI